MTESECLQRMIAPGQRRPSKPYREGVIQIIVTSSCDKACFGCTQASQLARPKWFMTPDQFGQACDSLRGYFGVVGMFGGNPALHPQFDLLCSIMRDKVPKEQRGIWSNNPITVGNAKVMRETFEPRYSNLNVHMDRRAYDLFKTGWPECSPVGLTKDSRHSPPYVAMRDVLRKGCPDCGGGGKIDSTTVENKVWKTYQPCFTCEGSGKVYDEERAWELISTCDINQHWSAMIGVFRGQLRAWFCEVAGAQAMLHQDEPDYPDTGIEINVSGNNRYCVVEGNVYLRDWWQLPMERFAHQVRKHCHDCGVPLRGYGELAQAEEGREQVSATHAGLFKPKRQGRQVEVVTDLVQIESGKIDMVTKYLQNSQR